jgi:hypothetical protein
MIEEEFMNEVHKNYGLVLRFIWRWLPDSGAEEFVEMENLERAIALNHKILSWNPSELKIEIVRDIRILNNFTPDLLLVDIENISEQREEVL